MHATFVIKSSSVCYSQKKEHILYITLLHLNTVQVAEADLLKLATKTYDRQKELEKQRTIFDRIMAYTSQNYNKDTKEFQPPINAYVGDYYNFIHPNK